MLASPLTSPSQARACLRNVRAAELAQTKSLFLLRWDLRCPMSNARAVRYRRLALATDDKAIADLLLKLADECDQGILCTAQWVSARPSLKNEQPPKAGGAKDLFGWADPLNDRR
jgi:hypothetical protein